MKKSEELKEMRKELEYCRRSIKILNKEMGVSICEADEFYDGLEDGNLSKRVFWVEKKLEVLAKHLKIIFIGVEKKTIPYHYKVATKKKEKPTVKK